MCSLAAAAGVRLALVSHHYDRDPGVVNGRQGADLPGEKSPPQNFSLMMFGTNGYGALSL